MEHINLLFTRNKKIGSILIRGITWSEWSHVEIMTDEQTVIGANIPVGVVEVSLEERLSHCTEHQIVRVPVTEDIKRRVIEWARGQVGRPYDYLGLLSFFAKHDLNDDRSWFCSELVAAAFEHGGAPIFWPGSTYRITPQDIYMLPYERVMS